MGLRVGGLVSGLDTNALIESLLALERRPLELAQQRRSVLELERSLFQDLNTRLLALRDAANGLDNLNSLLEGPSLDEELLEFVATSSDESVLTATASSNASPGATDITVSALAGSTRQVSTAYATDTEIVAAEGETLTFQVGSEDPIVVTVGAGGASLTDLRGLINSTPELGGLVRANVLFDGSGYRLIIEGLATGAANDVSMTPSFSAGGGGAFFEAAFSTSASDAQLVAFGVPVTRQSNQVSDVIPGVSLDLIATSATPVQVSVQRDDEAIAAKLQTFVDAYNDIVDFIDEQSDIDIVTQEGGPLSGDSTLIGIQLTLSRTVTAGYEFADNPLTSFAQLGVSVDRDGRLSLNEATLSEALDADPAAVRELLGGDGTSDGIASALARALRPVIEPGDGPLDAQGQPTIVPSILQVREQGFQDRIRSIDQQIERIERRLERREELLVLQFSRLESTLSALTGQGSSLAGLLNSQNGN